MYSTLKAPLLWYTLFADTLKRDGFELNPYDNCVANKVVDGKQFTICWYVDDIKLSHVSETEVTKMIDLLERKFDKLNITHRNSHSY